ncbi:M23 family metallopeptidase [Methylobacterium sp. 285MFTsu5.1]|uniref:M23 family metallopeptidase n=1 Tax=Methylobacterium sp. 285MFTsu5.1 TaxID=1172187 RepID=UPI00035C1A88|nr:M23 family metallopeptidase [Methylobacterium sp. 285MFTsu5.1]
MAAYLVALLLVWAAVASWFAYSGDRESKRLATEQASQKAAYEDKVRALTRRLVGVASHQVLEQDGLAGRIADIVTRQVDLENRLATLNAYAQRVAEPSRAPTETPAREPAPTTGPSAGESNVLQLGRSRDLGQSGPGPRSDLGGTGADSISGRVRAFLALPTREQFAGLEVSLDRVDRMEVRVLGGFAQRVRDEISILRGALTGLGVAMTLQPASAIAAATGPRDAFEAATRTLEAAFAEQQRWRLAADQVPLRRPIEQAERHLTSNFGQRKDPFTGTATMHAGMDFRAPVGTEVRATAAGRVITAAPTGGYGNLVEIDHGGGVVTRYGHLSVYAVSAGQAVRPETVIGQVGSTGRSTGPHLHYETRVNSVAVDPLRFLKAGSVLPNMGAVSEIVEPHNAGGEESDD